MIVDTSALAAIVFQEPDSEALTAKLSSSTRSGIGTPTLAELGLVLTARLGSDARSLVGRLLEEFSIVEISFGPSHWREAVSAFRRYGRGQHQASLNLGDCLTYAVARLADEPLLFVGEDFAATDLVRA